MSKFCNYARVAIRTIAQTYQRKGISLVKGAVVQVREEYNEHFQSSKAMELSYVMATKKIPQILKAFNQRWHPQYQRQRFLETFSLAAWTCLPQQDKEHSLRNCTACGVKHLSLTRSFPGEPKVTLEGNPPTITFTKHDLSSQRALGRKVLSEVNAISQEHLSASVQQVLSNTPQSHLIKKPSSTQRLTEMRKSCTSYKEVYTGSNG